MCILIFLCYIITLNVPNCAIVVSLYVFNNMCLFTVVTNCSLVTFGNSFLKRYVGIILPSLPVSILYFIFTQFLPANIFKLAVMMDQFTFHWTRIHTHHFYLLTGLFTYDFLLYFMYCSALFAPADSPEVTSLVALCAHLAICWAVPGLMEAATVSTCLPHSVAWLCLSFWAFFIDCSRYLYLSNSFCSVILFIASA